MTTDAAIKFICGRGMPLPGNDIDTDRIIPARFLRCITFEGLGEHAFEDDRKQDPSHPFNQKKYDGASILIVGRNFGCGSSREHAPQALRSRGIRAILGESFAEIFFSNCLAIGIPCLTLSAEHIAWLINRVSEQPQTPIEVDLESLRVNLGGHALPAAMPESARRDFLLGTWNSTQVLLSAAEAIEQTYKRLPYISGFSESA
jgi:3-isopropylmalate/(R)-2-methylmalate dehydratase small subunit